MGPNQYSDGIHDVHIGDVFLAEGKLVDKGIETAYFRVACFDSIGNIVADGCVPDSEGTDDLSELGHIMAWGSNLQYPVTMSGQPSAVQYQAEAESEWKWVSDLLKEK